jgi:hypothetical protein
MTQALEFLPSKWEALSITKRKKKRKKERMGKLFENNLSEEGLITIIHRLY